MSPLKEWWYSAMIISKTQEITILVNSIIQRRKIHCHSRLKKRQKCKKKKNLLRYPQKEKENRSLKGLKSPTPIQWNLRIHWVSQMSKTSCKHLMKFLRWTHSRKEGLKINQPFFPKIKRKYLNKAQKNIPQLGRRRNHLIDSARFL